ncbi:helix-turn-helix domain-containing protein [Streptomyces decoyicus]|uniref:helix-turn-helix domain-containing protein n=1 Tax=Streptomyces decoyicus TaxID=249567 RepID=UPI000B1BB260|nr:helix-turn-helix domain-containing protein [Streptomyces decoyicus]
MTHIRQYQPDRYTIIGNHLAQHRELSLTAIGVGTHILSLPEGASVDIRSLAARFPEGRDRIAFALRELEAHGYVERVRERTSDGRVITRTYAHNAPGAHTEAYAAEAPEAGARLRHRPSRPRHQSPPGHPPQPRRRRRAPPRKRPPVSTTPLPSPCSRRCAVPTTGSRSPSGTCAASPPPSPRGLRTVRRSRPFIAP